MVIRTAPQWPVIFTFRLLDWEIIDTRVTVMHDATFIELPVPVAISPGLVAGVNVPFISVANRDMRAVERPPLLDESLDKCASPFADEELLDFLSASHKLRSV